MHCGSALKACSKLKISLLLCLVPVLLQRSSFVCAGDVASLIDLTVQGTTNESVNANAAAIINNNGSRPIRLLIYDPRTGQQATVFEYMRPTFDSTFDVTRLWQPCEGTSFSYQCCLGLKLGEFLDNNFCFDAHYSPAAEAINLGISFNERYNLTSSIPVNAAPTSCIPLPTPLPIYICLRVDSVLVLNDAVTMCATLLFRFLQNDLKQFSLGCVRFGKDGLFFDHFAAKIQL